MSKIVKFLKEVRQEFNNITWPTKDTLLQLSFVVISISIIISLILGGFDYIFTQSFNLLTKLKPKTSTNITLPSPVSTDSADIRISTDSAQPQE